jgi:hypothetical protein
VENKIDITVNEENCLSSSLPGCEIWEDHQPSESPTIATSNLPTISPEDEHLTAASVPRALVLSQRTFTPTDLFRDNVAAII